MELSFTDYIKKVTDSHKPQALPHIPAPPIIIKHFPFNNYPHDAAEACSLRKSKCFHQKTEHLIISHLPDGQIKIKIEQLIINIL